MELEVEWQGKTTFSGITPSGHKIITDIEQSAGGDNQGMRPMEMLLGALVGATGIDVLQILKKEQLEPKKFHIKASGETALKHPKRFTVIQVHYSFWGALPEDEIIRAIELSLNKYCSVAYSLKAKISGSYSLNDEEGEKIEIDTGGN